MQSINNLYPLLSFISSTKVDNSLYKIKSIINKIKEIIKATILTVTSISIGIQKPIDNGSKNDKCINLIIPVIKRIN